MASTNIENCFRAIICEQTLHSLTSVRSRRYNMDL